MKEEIRKVYDRIREQGLLDLIEEYPAEILERVSKDVCKPFGVSRKVI